MSDVNISIDGSKLEKLSEKVMGDAAGAMVMIAYSNGAILQKNGILGSGNNCNISESCGLLQRYVEEFLAANVALGMWITKQILNGH